MIQFNVITVSCVDLLVRMEARRNDPSVNSEDLDRERQALQNETDKLMQNNMKTRDVSSVRFGSLGALSRSLYFDGDITAAILATPKIFY